MTVRVVGCMVLAALCAPFTAAGQQPPPAAPAGVVPPDQKLDGSGAMERLTYFADVPTYRASNPVVSDDGRYMAFQMGRSGVAAGIGYGLFLYDFTKAPASGSR